MHSTASISDSTAATFLGPALFPLHVGGGAGRRFHGRSSAASRPTAATPAAPARTVERRLLGGGGWGWATAARSVEPARAPAQRATLSSLQGGRTPTPANGTLAPRAPASNSSLPQPPPDSSAESLRWTGPR